MQSYSKPQFIVEESSAEGVYMASGVTETEKISTSVTQTSSGNQWYTVSTFDVTITNNTEENLTDWSCTLNVTGTATSAQIYDSWTASASLDNGKIRITPGGGGQIAAKSSITVQVVVGYSGSGVSIG